MFIDSKFPLADYAASASFRIECTYFTQCTHVNIYIYSINIESNKSDETSGLLCYILKVEARLGTIVLFAYSPQVKVRVKAH